MHKKNNTTRIRKWLGNILLGLLIVTLLAVYLINIYKTVGFLVWSGFQDKTLWDILELIIVPVVLTIAVALFNKSQSDRSEERQKDESIKAADQILETEWQNYLDKIVELLEKGLLESPIHSTMQNVARIRTLTALRRLDGKRKGLLLKFIYESDLIVKKEYIKDGNLYYINKCNPQATIFLHGADFGGADAKDIDITGSNLMQVDFSGANLSNSHLGQCVLWDANLTNANLDGAFLAKSLLFSANLTSASLVSAELSGARLRKACLVKANLENANLSNADLRETDLRGTDLRGCNLELANIFLSKIDNETKFDKKWGMVWNILNKRLENVDFSEQDFSQASFLTNLSDDGLNYDTFIGITFSDLNLRNADFSGSQLIHALFRKSNLQGAKFVGANLNHASFWEVNLTGANFRFADLQNANFSGVDLREVIIEEAKIDSKWKLVWEIVNLGGREKDLQNADFLWANLEKADLAQANLKGANLDYANLKGANLTNANLDSVSLFAAKIDKETKIDETWLSKWKIQENDDGEYSLYQENEPAEDSEN